MGEEIVKKYLEMWKTRKIEISDAMMDQIILRPSTLVDIFEGLFGQSNPLEKEKIFARQLIRQARFSKDLIDQASPTKNFDAKSRFAEWQLKYSVLEAILEQSTPDPVLVRKFALDGSNYKLTFLCERVASWLINPIKCPRPDIKLLRCLAINPNAHVAFWQLEKLADSTTIPPKLIQALKMLQNPGNPEKDWAYYEQMEKKHEIDPYFLLTLLSYIFYFPKYREKLYWNVANRIAQWIFDENFPNSDDMFEITCFLLNDQYDETRKIIAQWVVRQNTLDEIQIELIRNDENEEIRDLLSGISPKVTTLGMEVITEQILEIEKSQAQAGESLPDSRSIHQKIINASTAVWQFLYLYKLRLETCGQGWLSERVHRGGTSQFNGIFRSIFGQDCPLKELEEIGILQGHGEKEDKIRIECYEFLPDSILRPILNQVIVNKWDPTPIVISVLEQQIQQGKPPEIDFLVRNYNLLPKLAMHYLEILSKDPVNIAFPLTDEVLEAKARQILLKSEKPNLYDLLTRLHFNFVIAVSVGRYMREQKYLPEFPNLPRNFDTKKQGHAQDVELVSTIKKPEVGSPAPSQFKNDQGANLQYGAPPVVIIPCPVCGEMVKFDPLSWKCPQCGAKWKFKKII